MSLKQQKTLSTKLKLCASAFLLVAPVIGLTACSHDDPMNYAPLTYDYLTPIFFNVSQMTVNNLSANTKYPRDISNLSPTTPAMALENMANNRLKARGSNGHAVFTINRASLQESGHNSIYGQMDVTLTIYNNNNQKASNIQASINRTYTPAKGDANSKANLYDVTQKMMQDMNVELEYQIRQHMGSWLVDASGNSLSGGIQTQDLSNPGKTPAKASATPAPSTTTTTPKTTHTPTTQTDDDLSAVFPGGKPEAAGTTTHTQPAKAVAPQSKYPVGSLGTIPESATPNGY